MLNRLPCHDQLEWDNLYIIGVKGQGGKQEPKIGIPKLLGQFLTFNFFLGTLFVFRANNLSDAALMFKNIFSLRYTGSISRLLPYMDLPEFYLVKQIISIKAPTVINYMYGFIMLLLVAVSVFIITRKNSLQLLNEAQTK